MVELESPTASPFIAAMLLRTARVALGTTPEELAQAAGCAAGLVRRIESGEPDPTLDTVERIVNGSGLEVRAAPASPGSLYSGPEPDAAEANRVRASMEEARALRADLGALAPGPPAGSQPAWDGNDPAPARCVGAAEGRHDAGGWGAVLVRSAIAEASGERGAFARAAGLDESALEPLITGEARPTVGQLAGLLARAGTGLRVRLEVYDDRDDGLHLGAVADPRRHRRIKRRAEEILAYFDTGLTNGPTEGTNLIVKQVKRQGFGYTNPSNYRLRVLHRCA